MNRFSKTSCIALLVFLSLVLISYATASTDTSCQKSADLNIAAKPLMPDGTPIVKVKKELYVKHPRPGVAVGRSTWYIGPGLERAEGQAIAWKSDEPMEPQIRYSKDNGKTWSDFVTDSQIMTFEEKYDIYSGEGGKDGFYDSISGLHVRVWLRQTIIKGPPVRGYNQSFWSVSEDNCRTWSKGKMFKYEQGAELDPDNPLDPNYLENNQMYPGNNYICHSNGTLIHGGTSINIPKDAPFAQWGRAVGSACFIARWDPKQRQYNWRRGNVVWIPRTDAICLQEAEVAELADGRVLVVWRAPAFPGMPTRKWYSVSTDGGLTLSEVKELKYDDTIHFYSPESFHRMIRHSVTGKLYWLGNITPQPSGRYPRYPLVIAEVDEKIPALKRQTATIIDDRQPQDTEQLQVSNFSLLENRETHDLELYLTRIGETSNFWEADCYKYILSFN